MVEGIIFGMTDIESDLSTCMSDPGLIISSFKTGVYFIQQGVTVWNLVNAFEEFYNAAFDIKEMIGSCKDVLTSYEVIYAEFENVVELLTEPAYSLTMDLMRIVWNSNEVYSDITHIVHSI